MPSDNSNVQVGTLSGVGLLLAYIIVGLERHLMWSENIFTGPLANIDIIVPFILAIGSVLIYARHIIGL